MNSEPTCPECRLYAIEVEGFCEECYETLVDTWRKLDEAHITTE